MSEYQYYEFLAVDRPLRDADRQALRALSTRARITATRFVNTYEWGDFKGDPAALMERWFDLHLYWANWGTRRLMLRLPKPLVAGPNLNRFLAAAEAVTVRTTRDHVVLDIVSENEDPGDEAFEDGPGWLGALAPLRADLIGGDLRPLYLLWLTALQSDALEDASAEPLPGIGPLTASLQSFADFLRIDPDLVRAAAETGPADMAAPPASAVRAAIEDLPESEKIAFLVRFFNSDPLAGADLRRLFARRLRPDRAAAGSARRTVATLRTRAEALRRDRKRAEADAERVRRQQAEQEAEKQQRARRRALAARGDAVWRDIETEVERRNASGYTRAVGLLSDLKALAAQRGLATDFERRLVALRDRHASKGRFIERLKAAGL